MRPGVEIISRAQPLPRSAPTDVGAAFMVGATETGDAVKLVRSMTEYVAEFGDRAGFTDAYDGADAFFREGGAKLTVARTNTTVLTAVPATGPDLSDEALQAMLRADLDVLAADLGLGDTTGLATKQDVIDVIEASVTPAEQIASESAAGYAEALTAADDGIASALLNLNKDYGPGQVFAAHTTSAVAATQTALLAHAAVNNRIALLHCADGTADAMSAAAAALRTSENARYGAMFAPTVTVPGVAAGTTRDVPYDAVEAGIIARNDIAFGPNVPAAGANGQARWATDVNVRLSDFDYQTLNESGVNMARMIYDGVRTYGYRTLVDPASPDGVWLDLGNARLNMAIVARAEVIAESFVFSQLDGRRRTISQFGGELRAMLVPYYEQGALYGESADDAFDVNVGQAVNSEETIANGELHAVLGVRMSPFAELVIIEIVKVATTEAIAA